MLLGDIKSEFVTIFKMAKGSAESVGRCTYVSGAGGRFAQAEAASLVRFRHTVAYAEGLLLVDNLSWRPKQALSDWRALFDTSEWTCSQKGNFCPSGWKCVYRVGL